MRRFTYVNRWLQQLGNVEDRKGQYPRGKRMVTFRKRLKLHLFQLSYPGLVL